MDSQILAKVIRGETVESIHRGHIIAIDGAGKTLLEIGDPQAVTYFRSACKPFQALPLITTGAADAFRFTEDEIALASASHSGEEMHVTIAAGMLAKIGLRESDLQCGKHFPFSEKETERILRANENVTQLHNNCSGKHAAMLATAMHLEADIATYLSIDHSVQQSILQTTSLCCEIPASEIAIGIDGCCAPNFAMPVAAMARGFLNLVAPPSDFAGENVRAAASVLVAAILKFPELIGGSERLDTLLMNAAPGKLISKVGADGVWLCGILPSTQFPSGASIALKIEDGDDKRARPVVAIELLRQFGILSNQDLREYSPLPINNRRGETVGRVETAIKI